MPKLDWMMLANYAEAPPAGGLLYVMGGAWDTVNVGAPPEGIPDGTVAPMVGFLVIRLLFHSTETERDHGIEVSLVTEDGAQVYKFEAQFRTNRTPGLPPSWEQGQNIILQLAGIFLPKFGNYEFNVLLDGNHLGSRPFRLLKGF